jgi:hypothetical protein
MVRVTWKIPALTLAQAHVLCSPSADANEHCAIAQWYHKVSGQSPLAPRRSYAKETFLTTKSCLAHPTRFRLHIEFAARQILTRKWLQLAFGKYGEGNQLL